MFSSWSSCWLSGLRPPGGPRRPFAGPAPRTTKLQRIRAVGPVTNDFKGNLFLKHLSVIVFEANSSSHSPGKAFAAQQHLQICWIQSGWDTKDHQRLRLSGCSLLSTLNRYIKESRFNLLKTLRIPRSCF